MNANITNDKAKVPLDTSRAYIISGNMAPAANKKAILRGYILNSVFIFGKKHNL